jgi:hypothetical protein
VSRRRWAEVDRQPGGCTENAGPRCGLDRPDAALLVEGVSILVGDAAQQRHRTLAPGSADQRLECVGLTRFQVDDRLESH